MDWTLAEIKAKVRQLTGRPDTAQLSEANLKNYINRFYRNTFPLILPTSELEGWYEKTLTASIDEYDLDEEYLTLDVPYTIDGNPVDFYENPSRFYQLWPESQTWQEAQPYSVLFYGRKLLFRPPPDKAYDFKAACIKRPTAFDQETDKPLNQAWGPAIAYGAGIDILMDAGETNEAQALSTGLGLILKTIDQGEIRDLTDRRSIPRY